MPPGIAKVQFMVTVPKKKRKRAVDRVLIRRRIREAYRLNRGELIAAAENNNCFRTLSIAMVYVNNDNMPYIEIEEKMKAAIKRLCVIATKMEEV